MNAQDEYLDLVYEMSGMTSEDVLYLLESDEPSLSEYSPEVRLNYAEEKVDLATVLLNQAEEDVDPGLADLMQGMANELFIRAKLAYQSVYLQEPGYEELDTVQKKISEYEQGLDSNL